MDYQAWLSRLIAFLDSLRRLSEADVEYDIRPASSGNIVDQIDRHLKMRIPLAIKRFMMNASGGVSVQYSWSPLPKSSSYSLFRHLFGDSADYIYGGLDLCMSDRLMELQDERSRFGEQADDDSSGGVFPFAEIKNGDVLAIAVQMQGAPIVYLSHECDSPGKIVAKNFDSFLSEWEKLCYLNFMSLAPFLSPMEEGETRPIVAEYLDGDSTAANLLRKILRPT